MGVQPYELLRHGRRFAELGGDHSIYSSRRAEASDSRGSNFANDTFPRTGLDIRQVPPMAEL